MTLAGCTHSLLSKLNWAPGVNISLGKSCTMRRSHTVCFNVSHLMLVNIADAVGSSKSD
jgi:hypothetical protein